MSSTSPKDLATSFRSIPRRLREAQGDTSPSLIEAHTSAIDGHLATAARLLHAKADAAAIGEAIDEIPAQEWDEATLDQLRSIALEIGTALRAVAAADPRNDD